MLDILKDHIEKIPAEYAEMHFEILQSTRIVYSKDSIEAIQTSKTSAGNVRVFDGGFWGFSSFNDDHFNLQGELALKNARLSRDHLKSANHRSLKLDIKPIQAEIKTDFKIAPDTISIQQKNALVQKYNEILKHPKIASSRVTYSDSRLEKYFVNSQGSLIKQTKIFTGVAYGAMARDGTNVQQAYESVGQYGGYELVENCEESIEKVRKRSLDLLNAKKIESGQYSVILDPVLAGVFAHEAFGHLSEADFLHENPRMQDVMILGREFGPDFLNIIDDGSLPGLAGFTPIDDEGIPGQKTYLIKNGKLTGRLHSRETAGAMKEDISGNARSISPMYQPIVRMTNTYIDNGNSNLEKMLESMDDGIYALNYLGGMTNLEMFTFSSGYAYRVKNGKIKELLRDVNLSGNVFTTLKNISAIGSDLQHQGGLGGCGKGGQSGLPVSTGSPHILIKDVLIGGM